MADLGDRADMENPKRSRACGWCGADISAMRRNAQYCCKQHKKNAGSRRHRERNPGYYKRYHGSPARVRWLEANRSRVRAAAREYARTYRVKNPDKNKAWWAANTEKHRLYQAARRQQKIANRDSVGVSERDWRRLLCRYRQSCAYCGTGDTKIHMDHVVPLSRGGRHAIGNVLPACLACNLSKSASFIIEWRWRTAGGGELAKGRPQRGAVA